MNEMNIEEWFSRCKKAYPSSANVARDNAPDFVAPAYMKYRGKLQIVLYCGEANFRIVGWHGKLPEIEIIKSI